MRALGGMDADLIVCNRSAFTCREAGPGKKKREKNTVIHTNGGNEQDMDAASQ